MAGEILQGGIGGASTGAGLGFNIGGPAGAGIGAGVGFLAGMAQGANQRKRMQDYQKAEAGVIPVDPALVALRERINQQERAYRAGTDPASGFAMQNQNNALAQTQANMVRSGVTNPGQLLRAQGQANIGMAQVGASAAQRADALIPMQGSITSAISERVYQRQQQNRAAALARAEQGQQDINNMFWGGLSTLPQLSAGFRQGAPQGGSVARQPNLSALYAYQPQGTAPGPAGPQLGTGLPQYRFGMNGWNMQPNYGLTY